MSQSSNMEMVIDFLTAKSPYTTELQAFWMAVQGAMIVRLGPNSTGRLHWFHAFALSVLFGFAGGLMGFVWMGKPSSMLSSDINMGACILAFTLVNYTPMNVGFRLLNTLPLSIVTTSFAQLFRTTGLIRFIMTCFNQFKNNPSPYYPIPVFGPIIYGTLLGNMGGFAMKGLEGHVINGVPWPMQNGLFCGTFYHFFVNDKSGPIGILLRDTIFPDVVRFGLDEETFAIVFVSVFMQVTGILQMKQFYGPSFTPFYGSIIEPWMDATTWLLGWNDSTYSAMQDAQEEAGETKKPTKKKKKKNA